MLNGSNDITTGEAYVSAYPDIVKSEVGATQARLTFAGGTDTVVEWEDPRLEEPVRALFGSGLALSALEGATEDDAMAEAAAGLMDYLVRGRLVVWWYGSQDARLMEVLPLRGTVDARRPVGEIAGFTLSDFAMLGYRDGRPTIAHPDVDGVLTFAPAGYALLPGVLAHGRVDAAEAPALPAGAALFLARCGFLSDPAAAPPARAAWSPEEWLLHRRTRTTSQLRLLAMADRADVVEPPPPHRVGAGQGIRLPEVSASPLGDIMDARRSYREPGPAPLSLEALSAVLWRVARHRADRFPRHTGLAPRNQPGGGALGEMEYYVAVNRCQGLERGFYFYDGYDHLLAPIGASTGALDRYLDAVSGNMMVEDARPDCVIVLATQHARLSKKYRGLAYRLTLLHVGVAYEALYLAGTELGLSPCAIGAGEMGYFQALTGREPHEETSVGEFVLNGPRPADPGSGDP